MMTLRERLLAWIQHAPPPAPIRPDGEPCHVDGCRVYRQPSAAPLDVMAYEERSREIAYAVAWFLEHWPDAWYFHDADKPLFDIAADLIALKLRIRAGRIAR